MAFTLEQHDALEAAIADCVLVVEYSDKKVTYKSTKDQERILYKMKVALGMIVPGGRRYTHFKSGL